MEGDHGKEECKSLPGPIWVGIGECINKTSEVIYRKTALSIHTFLFIAILILSAVTAIDLFSMLKTQRLEGTGLVLWGAFFSMTIFFPIYLGVRFKRLILPTRKTVVPREALEKCRALAKTLDGVKNTPNLCEDDKKLVDYYLDYYREFLEDINIK